MTSLASKLNWIKQNSLFSSTAPTLSGKLCRFSLTPLHRHCCCHSQDSSGFFPAARRGSCSDANSFDLSHKLFRREKRPPVSSCTYSVIHVHRRLFPQQTGGWMQCLRLVNTTEFPEFGTVLGFASILRVQAYPRILLNFFLLNMKWQLWGTFKVFGGVETFSMSELCTFQNSNSRHKWIRSNVSQKCIVPKSAWLFFSKFLCCFLVAFFRNCHRLRLSCAVLLMSPNPLTPSLSPHFPSGGAKERIFSRLHPCPHPHFRHHGDIDLLPTTPFFEWVASTAADFHGRYQTLFSLYISKDPLFHSKFPRVSKVLRKQLLQK